MFPVGSDPSVDTGARVAEASPLNPFILKIASRCNLNCSYCYMYNGQDTSWRDLPRVMSPAVFDAFLRRVARHCARTGQGEVHLIFHGGEPLLVGVERFDAYCRRAREVLAGTQVSFAVQTNGTRLTDAWAACLAEHDVTVNVSLDGPPEVNDLLRVDHAGRGSHRAVLDGLAVLHRAGVDFGIYSVVAPGADGLRVHEHFLELGPVEISYLWPAETHDTVGAVRALHGPTPIADFLVPVFDHWWRAGGVPRVREFWNVLRMLLGGSSTNDVFGNPPLRFVSVDSDGSVQGLDKLRMCDDGLADTGLTVLRDDFSALSGVPFHAELMQGPPTPTPCLGCPERATCGGGHVTHRYRASDGFDHESVWCADIMRLFTHIRDRTGITHRETRERRSRMQPV